jgi:hypothetical protein
MGLLLILQVKEEAVGYSKMMVITHQTIQCHNQEKIITLNLHCHQNLKHHTSLKYLSIHYLTPGTGSSLQLIITQLINQFPAFVNKNPPSDHLQTV